MPDATPPDTTPIVSVLNWVPQFARGRVRDIRVRWAYEEIGRLYQTHLLALGDARDPDYLAWHPFNQVPALREGDVEMFESGAILLRIGEQDVRLLPRDEQARWQVISWLFAALTSVEPAIMQLSSISFFHRDKPWSADALAALTPFARQRLQRLADALGDREWLAGDFSIADIAMATVFLAGEDALIADQPRLIAYRDRAFARPAFRRARDAQLGDFDNACAPAGRGA